MDSGGGVLEVTRFVIPFMTVFLTVISGVLTFVFGQLIVRLVVEPVQELKKTIAQISHALIQLRSIYQNPGVSTQELESEASSKLRDLASHLHGRPMKLGD